MAKILVVDDEPHVVRLCQVNLQRAGYVVVTAGNGEEALKKIATEKPDLIVLDLYMPWMDGFTCYQQLQNDPGDRDIPVIVLTCEPQTNLKDDKAKVLGADAYLTKPFDILDLLSFVKRLLAKDETAEGS